MLPLFYSVSSVVFISLISIIAIYFLISKIPNFQKYSLSLVSLAVGSLLGDAFIHILPEASEHISNQTVNALLIITGILLFFTLEKIVRWRHCHDPECLSEEDKEGDHQNHIVANSMVGELFHNFIDGVIIASSFIISPGIGFATTLAVLLHEIPQEIGDFAIYLHQGRTLFQSLKLNLIAASSSIFGVLFTFLIGNSISNFSLYMLPITAGGFIYLASSDLIPELHRHEQSVVSSLSQIILVILGVTLMASLLLLE